MNRASTTTFDVFRLVYLILVLICWASTLALASYGSPVTGVPELLSFRTLDQPWMPIPQSDFGALFGGHWFGDFAIWVGYASVANPYDASLYIYPAQQPPISLTYFAGSARLQDLELFGVRAILLSYLATMVIPFVGVLWFLGREALRRDALLNALTFGLLAAPTVVAIDRGSTLPLVIAIVGAYFLALARGKLALATVLFIVAASFKPYLLFLLVVPAVRGRARHSFVTIATFGFVTLLSFLWWGKASGVALRGFIGATSSHSSGPNISWLQDSTSFAGLYYKVTVLFSHIDLFGSWFGTNPVALWGFGLLVLMLIFLVSRSNAPDWVALALGLASMQMVVPLSGLYTPIWASLAAVVCFSRRLTIFPLYKRHRLNGSVDYEASLRRGSVWQDWASRVEPIAVTVAVALVALAVLACLLPVPWSLHASNDVVIRLNSAVPPMMTGLALFAAGFAAVLWPRSKYWDFLNDCPLTIRISRLGMNARAGHVDAQRERT